MITAASITARVPLAIRLRLGWKTVVRPVRQDANRKREGVDGKAGIFD